MIEHDNPYSKEELKKAALLLKENLFNFFQSIPENELFEYPQKGWSPAENIVHMNKVTKLLGLTFYSPKFISNFFFGENKEKTSKPFSEISDIYLKALKEGKDSGPFTPGKENPLEKITKRKDEILSDWNKNLDKYSTVLENWKEEDLDSTLTLHPFLGKITVREMYMIGILHPVHHSSIVAERLEK
ncbi:MAG: DinB family protein, partial [Leptospiraceae bacterium]|nr:DinB family protein [Leptospiraceae bacterium]